MAAIISIDIPSGLLADGSSQGQAIITATYTLSFECNKLAFMFAENADYMGNVHLLSIGLHQQYYLDTESSFATIDQQLVRTIYKPRQQFTHKYSFGHALLYAGSKNMMGAAVLCAKACLRCGAGLVTVHTDEPQMPIIQTALPEAIASAENDIAILTKKKAAIGIGPGLAINESNAALLLKLIDSWDGPLVIDASALGLLQPHLLRLSQRKKNTSILTPHTGEFEKLFGKASSDFERMQLALQKAAQLNSYIILKGKNSLVACPDGKAYFNTTGNSGMATAGSGDVLTGILTGLLAQGYTAEHACMLGVYLHGLAGDFAAVKFSQEAMIAGDITEQLGEAYQSL
jgi:NAD(P)H-hydrate epimerase